jgi:hypothetical protein
MTAGTKVACWTSNQLVKVVKARDLAGQPTCCSAAIPRPVPWSAKPTNRRSN